MSNDEMVRYWNDSAGPVWVAQQERLDAQIGPLGALARERASIRGGERVLGDMRRALMRRAQIRPALQHAHGGASGGGAAGRSFRDGRAV